MEVKPIMNYESLKTQITTELKNRPRLLILGIGENRMGDDGIGQYISFYLGLECHCQNVRIINGGIVPEERLKEINDFRPEFLLVIDAISMNEPPGTVKLLDEKKMLNYLPISSHSMPLPVFIDKIKQANPAITMKLLGICPFSLQFLERYVLFAEDDYTLDDKDENLNIPFYAFNLTDQIKKIGAELIALLKEVLKLYLD